MNRPDIPLLFGKAEDKAIFHPEDLVAQLQKHAGTEKVKIGEHCILCYPRPLFSRIIRKAKAEEVEGWVFQGQESRKLYSFSLGEKQVSLINLEFGASSAGTMMEILIACGVKGFLTIGSAGTLQDGVKIGDFVIAEDAIRDEGVSYHYLAPSERVRGNHDALEALDTACQTKGVICHRGTTWTTDALFRETVPKVSKYRREGVLTVEMEAATLYAISKFREVKTGCFFYVTDSLADLEWRPAFYDDAVKRALNQASDIILRAIELFMHP